MECQLATCSTYCKLITSSEVYKTLKYFPSVCNATKSHMLLKKRKKQLSKSPAARLSRKDSPLLLQTRNALSILLNQWTSLRIQLKGTF